MAELTTSTSRRFVVLLGATAGYDGIRAGAGVFRCVLDLPARSNIGVVAFAELSRATDLSPRGIVFYVAFGFLGAFLTCASAIAAWQIRASSSIRRLTSVAAASSIVILLMTTQAAPLMFRIGRSPNEPTLLSSLIEPFVLWTYLRCLLAGVSFLATLSALVRTAMGRIADSFTY